MSAPPAESVHKPSRQGELLGTAFFLTVWGTFFVGARIYTRVFQTKSFGWDDGFILLSCLAGWTGMVLTVKEVQHGLGTPFASRSLIDLVYILKYQNFAIFCNGLAMAFLKIGIGASLLRLRLNKAFNAVVWACIILSCIVNLQVFAGCFAKCRPLNKIWNKAVPGTCWPQYADLISSYSQTAGNILTDLLFSFGPLYFLAKVKVSKYNKWALRGVFVVGLLGTACAIAKCTELPKLGLKTTDFTYDTVALDIWVAAELNAGLFAASIPPLKSTFELILVRIFNVRSGLTTPSATATFKSNGYQANSYGPASHSKSGSQGGNHTIGGGAFNFNRNRSHNNRTSAAGGHGDAVYLDDLRTNRSKSNKRRDPDEISSEEEDQKHILRSHAHATSGSMKTGSEEDGNDGWITKTVEYTVRDDVSTSHGQNGGRGPTAGGGGAGSFEKHDV